MQTTVTVGAISFQVDSRPHHRFWKNVNRGKWEPETFAIFDRHISRETMFIDVGAWIGSTSLYGAQLAQQTHAFEPDPVAFAELSRNIAANAGAHWFQRLSVYESAINKDGRSFTLGGSAEGADSMSSALFPNRESQWTVHALRLPDILSEHRKTGQHVFLKVDIEGGEYDLLPEVRDILADPLVTAYISFHPGMLRRSLTISREDENWKQSFVDLHLAVVDSLPWSRWVGLRTGERVSKQLLEHKVRIQLAYPEELLIRSP
jgi:FkbM family methyltransferase